VVSVLCSPCIREVLGSIRTIRLFQKYKNNIEYVNTTTTKHLMMGEYSQLLKCRVLSNKPLMLSKKVMKYLSAWGKSLETETGHNLVLPLLCSVPYASTQFGELSGLQNWGPCDLIFTFQAAIRIFLCPIQAPVVLLYPEGYQ
jgi:hypothetical protein